jgi:hypothetical protein
MSMDDSTLGIPNPDPPEKDWKDSAQKWLEVASKLVVPVAAIFGIYPSIVIPKNLSKDSLNSQEKLADQSSQLQAKLADQNAQLQTKLAEQSAEMQTKFALQSSELQKTIQEETSKREYVQMALAVLKENQERTDPRIRRLAAEIFIKNSPVKVPPGLEEALATSNSPFPFLSPEMASTSKGQAFQLAGDMFAFVVQSALKLPEYQDLPKHTSVPEHISKDMLYKFYTLKEFDDDFAKEFHKRFDDRTQTALLGLEKALMMLNIHDAQDTCTSVNGVRTGEECASKIFAGASFRNPD